MKKPLLFIMLNIFISAVTTVIVLIIWDASHKTAEPQPSDAGGPAHAINLSECDGTIPEGSEVLLEVVNATGIGDIKKEEITIQYSGADTVCLNGWVIKGRGNNEYAFPKFYQLFTEGVQIKLRSRVGEDTALELYWDLVEAAWSPGEVINVVDAQGSIHSTFVIP